MMNDAVAFTQFKAQWIKEVTPELNSPGVKILDVGCGDGLMTYYLQEVFFQAQVIGVDKDVTIEKARKQFPDISFISFQDDTFTIDTKDSFDVIIISFMLHHLTAQQQNALLESIDTYLKSGGILIILEFNPLSLLHIVRPIQHICFDAVTWVSYKHIKKILRNYHFFGSRYACFFPPRLKFLTPFEGWISGVPLGSLIMYRWQKTKENTPFPLID